MGLCTGGGEQGGGKVLEEQGGLIEGRGCLMGGGDDLPVFDTIVGVQGHEPAAHAQDIVVRPRLRSLTPHQPSEVVHLLKVRRPALPAPNTPAPHNNHYSTPLITISFS